MVGLLHHYGEDVLRRGCGDFGDFLELLRTDLAQVAEEEDEDEFHSVLGGFLISVVGMVDGWEDKTTDLSLVIMSSPCTMMPFII